MVDVGETSNQPSVDEPEIDKLLSLAQQLVDDEGSSEQENGDEDDVMQTQEKNSNFKMEYQAAKASLLKEIESLRSKRKVPLTSNILDFWKENQKQFPTLFDIALDIFYAPITETAIESVFSHLKNTLADHRVPLLNDALNNLMLMRVNHYYMNDIQK